MIVTVVLKHEDGRQMAIETALNNAFLERIYPGWRVIHRDEPK